MAAKCRISKVKERKIPSGDEMLYHVQLLQAPQTELNFKSSFLNSMPEGFQTFWPHTRHYLLKITGPPNELAQSLSLSLNNSKISSFSSLSAEGESILWIAADHPRLAHALQIFRDSPFFLNDLANKVCSYINNRFASPLATEIGGKTFVWGDRTYVMGIINITPDSFSGDGLAKSLDPSRRIQQTIEQAETFVAEGVDILDVGGESTRPGAQMVDAEEEMERVIPIVQTLANNSSLPISIDTQKAVVAETAVKAGAVIINDIWGLQGDPNMARVAADHGTAIVVMHNKSAPGYRDLMGEIIGFLETSMEIAFKHGISRERVWLDPGIGFGKTREDNLTIINRLDELKVLGQPILLGTSRKSVIGLTLGLPVEERIEGTSATVALGITRGADLVRVHDVRAMIRTARMTDAMVRHGAGEGETDLWSF